MRSPSRSCFSSISAWRSSISSCLDSMSACVWSICALSSLIWTWVSERRPATSAVSWPMRLSSAWASSKLIWAASSFSWVVSARAMAGKNVAQMPAPIKSLRASRRVTLRGVMPASPMLTCVRGMKCLLGYE